MYCRCRWHDSLLSAAGDGAGTKDMRVGGKEGAGRHMVAEAGVNEAGGDSSYTCAGEDERALLGGVTKRALVSTAAKMSRPLRRRASAYHYPAQTHRTIYPTQGFVPVVNTACATGPCFALETRPNKTHTVEHAAREASELWFAGPSFSYCTMAGHCPVVRWTKEIRPRVHKFEFMGVVSVRHAILGNGSWT